MDNFLLDNRQCGLIIIRKHARTHAYTTHTSNHFTALLDLLEQETVSDSGISWAICKSAPWLKHITMPESHYSVFTGWMPFLPPNQ